MAEDSSEEKTEAPTQQRRDDFRKSGQVAQSREIGSILVLLGVAVVFYFLSKDFILQIETLFKSAFTDYFLLAARSGDMIPALRFCFERGFAIITPIFAVAMITGTAATVMQIGFLAAWEHISPDIERINPVSGFARLFKMRNLIEGAKSVLKVSVISFIAYLTIKKEMQFTPQMVLLSVPQILSYIGHVLFKLFGSISALMAFVAMLDYGFQKWELEKRMRMSKQEIKEEYKQREGDPLIKSRIKRIARELAQKRMMDQVPKADVIITNPTHIAVAIKYDRTSMAAPALIAKGADLIAEKMKQVARAHGIPVVENKMLARTIFKTMKVGHGIPKSLYHAVAEILAYVYRIKGRLQQVTRELNSDVVKPARGTNMVNANGEVNL